MRACVRASVCTLLDQHIMCQRRQTSSFFPFFVRFCLLQGLTGNWKQLADVTARRCDPACEYCELCCIRAAESEFMLLGLRLCTHVWPLLNPAVCKLFIFSSWMLETVTTAIIWLVIAQVACGLFSKWPATVTPETESLGNASCCCVSKKKFWWIHQNWFSHGMDKYDSRIIFGPI